MLSRIRSLQEVGVVISSILERLPSKVPSIFQPTAEGGRQASWVESRRADGNLRKCQASNYGDGGD